MSRIEDLHWVLPVKVPLVDYMIQTSTGQAQNQAQEKTIPDVFWICASPLGLTLGHPSTDYGTSHNDNAVPGNGNGTYTKSDPWTLQFFLLSLAVSIHRCACKERGDQACGSPTCECHASTR
jgi:hypothetical protein